MRQFIALIFLLPCIASAETIVGRVVSVADGDTLIILTPEKTEMKIRLAAIDAPEKAMPFGEKSKQALASMCFGVDASVESVDVDRYGRTVGTITCSGKNANEAQIRAGMAWVYRKYSKGFEYLMPIEEAARASKVGLWADKDPTPPWEWRKSNR